MNWLSGLCSSSGQLQLAGLLLFQPSSCPVEFIFLIAMGNMCFCNHRVLTFELLGYWFDFVIMNFDGKYRVLKIKVSGFSRVGPLLGKKYPKMVRRGYV